MEDLPASKLIDDIIQLYGGWKGETLSAIRAAVVAANPAVTEEVKWRMKTRPEGLPVWYLDGILCLAETFKNDIKLVFTKGVYIDDPNKLFNARLDSSTDRAIAFREGDKVDVDGIRLLTLKAIELNAAKSRKM